VAGRALEIVHRELQLAPELDARHADRLAVLGVADVRELAAQVRAGRDDEQTVRAIREHVVDKLRVADPRLLRR
jgi:hypothetical protein